MIISNRLTVALIWQLESKALAANCNSDQYRHALQSFTNSHRDALVHFTVAAGKQHPPIKKMVKFLGAKVDLVDRLVKKQFREPAQLVCQQNRYTSLTYLSYLPSCRSSLMLQFPNWEVTTDSSTQID